MFVDATPDAVPDPPPGAVPELLAALERTDVSEPMRAALAYALTSGGPPVVPPGSADPFDDPRELWTLHLTFPAANLESARAKAICYAEGLAALRPEVGVHLPLLSRVHAWQHVAPLFCGVRDEAAGSACIAVPGHDGPHRVAPLRGHRWGKGRSR